MELQKSLYNVLCSLITASEYGKILTHKIEGTEVHKQILIFLLQEKLITGFIPDGEFFVVSLNVKCPDYRKAFMIDVAQFEAYPLLEVATLKKLSYVEKASFFFIVISESRELFTVDGSVEANQRAFVGVRVDLRTKYLASTEKGKRQ